MLKKRKKGKKEKKKRKKKKKKKKLRMHTYIKNDVIKMTRLVLLPCVSSYW